MAGHSQHLINHGRTLQFNMQFKLYEVTNTKTSESYIMEEISADKVRQRVINSLDLSLDWNIKLVPLTAIELLTRVNNLDLLLFKAIRNNLNYNSINRSINSIKKQIESTFNQPHN